ncbi:MAG: GTP pyrophosphokinase [Desulfobacteraceae bacterium 4572_130]|nr:MAG: GTP pyrophosphokinase [Desulfobacteraceae bacterium 4572_130]
MIRINDILDKIIESNPNADLSPIDKAYIYAARAHAGHTRLSGEPYLSHPLEVALILADMKLDVESVAAALLHDVIEDTPVTKQDIIKMFGSNIGHIVEGVTKISKLKFSTKVAQQAESLKKMILAMADDIRVILIKLADRLHNMRTLKYHKSADKQRMIAQETLDIYMPLAARLGIFWIKYELGERGFFYSMPEEYDKIDMLINKKKGGKEKYIKTVNAKLKQAMDKACIKAEIKGRYKQHYSIYQKMISQNLDFGEIYDIVAFRLIFNTVPQCYEAMGVIHSMWKPISYKFKDYIGIPKPNMYQSLHTTVIGPYGERVEIQLRTKEMDKIAESGIAAHWTYKEGVAFDKNNNKVFEWIKNLVENQDDSIDPDEFIENVRIDLYPADIYVFTPQGEIKTLRKGATPVDFAFMVHSEIGIQCTGARVNGKLVSLDTKLETGDTIEIIITKGHAPSFDWLNFVKSVRAKTKIRQWIRTFEKKRSISLGREMCEKLFRKKNQNFNGVIKSGKIEKCLDCFAFKSVDDLIAHVGFGKITPLHIFHKIFPHEEEQQNKKDPLKDIIKKEQKGNKEGIVVKGLNDVLFKISKCCNPLPGDLIIGFITQGQGIAVHRKNCINVLKMSSERRIDVQWDKEIKESYPVKICVCSTDRFGLLADVASTISKNNINIVTAYTKNHDFDTALSYFTISVESTKQLRKIILDIKKVKQVRTVKRIASN